MQAQIQITALTKKPDVGELNPALNWVWKHRKQAWRVVGPDKTLYVILSAPVHKPGGKNWYEGFYLRRGGDSRKDWIGCGSYFSTIEEVVAQEFRKSSAGIVKQMEMEL